MRASMVCSANGTKTLNFPPPNGVENRGFLGLNELIFIKFISTLIAVKSEK